VIAHHLESWLNLYRADDFVGTKIEEGTKTIGGVSHRFPANELVYGRGHMGYWKDTEAITMARSYLPG
jgi:hypothetical protein